MNDLIFLESVKQMPLIKFPVRSTVVPLRTARILISPGSRLSEEQLKNAGAVTDIVAPSLFHCAGIPQAHKIFPHAKVWGPPGAKDAKSDMPWTDWLSEKSWPYQAELALIPLEGMPKIEEHLLVHKSSKTLIVTDLCFNLRGAKGFGAWLIFKLFDTGNKFSVSKMFVKFITDKKAFEASLAKLEKADFKDIVITHGVNEANGREKLFSALAKRGFYPRA